MLMDFYAGMIMCLDEYVGKLWGLMGVILGEF